MSYNAVAQHGAAIAQRLEHVDEHVRIAAVKALGTSANAVAQHAAAISQRLEDSDSSVREAAVEALGRLLGAVAQHRAAMAKRLEHSDEDMSDCLASERRSKHSLLPVESGHKRPRSH